MRGASLSLTLVEDGWAELDEDGAADPVLSEASARAAREHRGVWARQAPP
jgi:endonuclease YncB( thermonuclease family)